VPDPGDLNVALKWETARLAKTRIGDRKPDERDLQDAHAHGREELRRVLFALPEDKLFSQLERTGITYTDDQKRQFLAYARRELRNDPIALEQPIADNFRDGQMMPMRAGTNLETALLICGVTGAFPYTNMASYQYGFGLAADYRGTRRIERNGPYLESAYESISGTRLPASSKMLTRSSRRMCGRTAVWRASALCCGKLGLEPRKLPMSHPQIAMCEIARTS